MVICDAVNDISNITVNYENLISQTIAKFSLNKSQSEAFSLIARHSVSFDASKPFADSNPLSIYLGGAGGTGKSTVIQALSTFIKKRDQSRWLRLSFTSVAAHNINGMTLHSLLLLTNYRSKRIVIRAH